MIWIRPDEVLVHLVEEDCDRGGVKEEKQLDADAERERTLVGTCNRAASAHLLECNPPIHLKKQMVSVTVCVSGGR